MLRMREGKGVNRFFGLWRYATVQAGKGDLEETLRTVRERAAKGLEREETMKEEIEKMQAEMAIFRRSLGEEKVKEGEMKRKRALRIIERWKTEGMRRCWVAWREGARRLKEEVRAEKLSEPRKEVACVETLQHRIEEELCPNFRRTHHAQIKRLYPSQRMLLEKFTRKLKMGSAWKVFTRWRDTVKDIKRKRLLVARFRRRYDHGAEMKSWGRWLDFVKLRRRARGITKRIVGGRDKDFLAKGFRKWLEGVRDEKENEDTARKVGMEKERKQAVAMKYVKSLMQGATGKAFRGWREWVNEEKAKRR
jgi:hypothetical protein